MKQVMHNNGTKKAVNDYHAIVPTWRAPIITGTVRRHGEIFYRDANGRLYIPHIYDAMFKAAKGIIMGKHYKGVNPGLKY
jgi:hypothetical protein